MGAREGGGTAAARLVPERAAVDCAAVEPFPGQDLALRASDADRDRVAERIREAFAEGRLDPEEHHERVELVYRARTLGDLAPLVADLPAASSPGGVVVPQTGSGLMPVLGHRGGEGRSVVAVFGAAERSGHWVVDDGMSTVAVFGGVDLDMREAALESPTTTMTVVAVFGGVDITLPDGVEVRTSGFSLFGGTDGPKDRTPPPHGAPVLRVRVYAVFGGVSLRRRKPRR